MLLTDARRDARIGPDGALVPLAEQDRSRWDRARIREGVALVEAALPAGPVGPYQLQAAIAAVHAEAERAEDTDWAQIAVLYEMLAGIAPGPAVALNRAVAVAMVEGPDAGLAMSLPCSAAAERSSTTGSTRSARTCWRWRATRCRRARSTCSRRARPRASPEQRYLTARAARLA